MVGRSLQEFCGYGRGGLLERYELAFGILDGHENHAARCAPPHGRRNYPAPLGDSQCIWNGECPRYGGGFAEIAAERKAICPDARSLCGYATLRGNLDRRQRGCVESSWNEYAHAAEHGNLRLRHGGRRHRRLCRIALANAADTMDRDWRIQSDLSRSHGEGHCGSGAVGARTGARGHPQTLYRRALSLASLYLYQRRRNDAHWNSADAAAASGISAIAGIFRR